MVITCVPTITKVINIARREVIMSVEIDDGDGDIRTITATGKVKEPAQKIALMDAVLTKYRREREWEAIIIPIKADLETDAKVYLEAQLNG